MISPTLTVDRYLLGVGEWPCLPTRLTATADPMTIGVRSSSIVLMERRKDHVPPAQWQDFEDLCLKLWRPRLIDAKKNGRSGQPQAGVDIFGRDPKTEAWVGIQCKQKGRWPPKVLRIRQIKKEIRKAAKFKPPLSHFIMSLPALPAPMYRIVPNAGNICRLHRRLRLSFARGTTFGCRAVTVFCRLEGI